MALENYERAEIKVIGLELGAVISTGGVDEPIVSSSSAGNPAESAAREEDEGSRCYGSMLPETDIL